jgi:predicted HTH domain antitoxin
MKITVEIPDEMMATFVPAGQAPEQAVLEAIAVEGYRTRRFGESSVARLLGLPTRFSVHELLAKRDMYLNYSVEDADHDLEVAREDARQWRDERSANDSERLAR